MRITNHLIGFISILTLLLISVNAKAEKIQVVTSFTILEDIVTELGGEHVNVVNLVGRNSDAHMYQPTPSDAVAITKADLVIFNGLGFEGWMTRLIENSGYKNTKLIASSGVSVLKNENEPDPHAWQSFNNIRTYIHNISNSLISLRPEYKTDFLQLKKQYITKLDGLEKELVNKLNKIPSTKRTVVTSHDAFGYLGQEHNIQFLAPLGLSIDVEPSAEDVSTIINQIRNQDVKALFVENINNPRLLNRISEETNVGIGGRLYSDALSEIDGPAHSYLTMMRHNLESLMIALNKQ